VLFLNLGTAIISLFSINFLVFITEMERVYCVVRYESFEFKSHVSKAALWLRQLEVCSRSQLSPGEI